jgi:hypothetical protein
MATSGFIIEKPGSRELTSICGKERLIFRKENFPCGEERLLPGEENFL